MEEKTMVTVPINYMCIHCCDYEHMIRRIADLDSENEDLVETNERLNAENAELHAENAALKLKVDRYEAFLDTCSGWFREKFNEWMEEESKDF